MRTRTNLKIMSGQFVTPAYIDVLFLLLIFFIVASSVVFFPGVPIDLPSAARSTPQGPAEKIVITITGENVLFFNDQHVTWSNLERELRHLIRERFGGNIETSGTRSPRVVIRADRGIPYGNVVRVMSLASSLGLGTYLVTDDTPP